jgi:hypothetical protein
MNDDDDDDDEDDDNNIAVRTFLKVVSYLTSL